MGKRSAIDDIHTVHTKSPREIPSSCILERNEEVEEKSFLMTWEKTENALPLFPFCLVHFPLHNPLFRLQLKQNRLTFFFQAHCIHFSLRATTTNTRPLNQHLYIFILSAVNHPFPVRITPLIFLCYKTPFVNDLLHIAEKLPTTITSTT